MLDSYKRLKEQLTSLKEYFDDEINFKKDVRYYENFIFKIGESVFGDLIDLEDVSSDITANADEFSLTFWIVNEEMDEDRFDIYIEKDMNNEFTLYGIINYKHEVKKIDIPDWNDRLIEKYIESIFEQFKRFILTGNTR